MQAWGEKSKNFFEKDTQTIVPEAPEEKFVAKLIEIEIDTSLNLSTKNRKQLPSELKRLEENLSKKPGSKTFEIYVDDSLKHTNKYSYQ